MPFVVTLSLITFSSMVGFWVTLSKGKTIGVPVVDNNGISVDNVALESEAVSVLLLSIGCWVVEEATGNLLVAVVVVIGVVIVVVVGDFVVVLGFVGFVVIVGDVVVVVVVALEVVEKVVVDNFSVVVVVRGAFVIFTGSTVEDETGISKTKEKNTQ